MHEVDKFYNLNAYNKSFRITVHEVDKFEDLRHNYLTKQLAQIKHRTEKTINLDMLLV